MIVPDKQLASLYVLIERKFEKFCPRLSQVINPETGELRNVIQQVVLTSEAEGSAVDSDGLGTEVRSINCDYSMETTRDVTPFLKRSWDTTINYYWPPVLLGIELNQWYKLQGGFNSYPRVVMDQEAYNGPCKATIVEEWFKTAPEVEAPEIMLPVSANYSCPFYSVNTGPCLHQELFFQADTGTNDPYWKWTINTKRIFPATNFTTWPDFVLSSVTVSPASGGFIKRSVTVFKPS
jgi:hypothetical protein